MDDQNPQPSSLDPNQTPPDGGAGDAGLGQSQPSLPPAEPTPPAEPPADDGGASDQPPAPSGGDAGLGGQAGA